MELLNTNRLTFELGEMIANEENCLILITPYIDPNENTKRDLKKSEAKIYIVFRKIYEKDPKELKEKLEKFQKLKKYLPNVNFIETNYLHAKIYMSSSKIIVTSLNLLKSSQNDNFELGFIFDNEKDDEMCKEIIEKIKDFLRANEVDDTILDKLYCKRCANKNCNELVENKFHKYCSKCNTDYKKKQEKKQ